MSGHGHWGQVENGTSGEMIAWNAVARDVIAGAAPSRGASSRVLALSRQAGYRDADAYLTETDGLPEAEISADSELSAMREDFEGYQDGRYFDALAVSEDMLLRDCRDPERSAEQRRAVLALCADARRAYEGGRQERIASGPAAAGPSPG